VSDAVIIAVVAALGGAGSAGFWAWLTARRNTSGQVSTTPAEILWQQTQQMLTAIQGERDKAVEQRDKLLDTVGTIGPTLASIDSSLRTLLVEVSALTSATPEP
jgi:hypothetical protein